LAILLAACAQATQAEPAIASKTCITITDFGAVSGGKQMNTAAIQKAIDACTDRGGGTVRIPKGVFLSGGLHLKSNVTLHLDKDAVLLGSSDWKDYGSPADWSDGFLNGADLVNVGLKGEGTIDGADCRNPGGGEGDLRGPHCIILNRCKGISIDGITVIRSANWAFNCIKCQDAVIDNLKVRGGHDGFDAFECANFVFKGCDFRTGDDCIAGSGSRDFVITDCYFNSSCNAFRFACINLTVRHCRFQGPGEYAHRSSGRHNMMHAFIHYSASQLVYKHGYKGLEPHTDHWVIEKCTVDNVDVFYEYNYLNRIWQMGRPVKGVHFRNIKATGLAGPIWIVGDMTRQFSMILENVDLQFRRGSESQEHINARQFSTIELRNVVLRNDGSVPALRVEDGDRLVLAGARCVPSGNPAPFAITRVARTQTAASTGFTPLIEAFSASNNAVEKGSPITLSWKAPSGKVAEILPGIGRIAAEGSRAVQATADTTWTLKAEGKDSTETAEVPVLVFREPAPTLASRRGLVCRYYEGDWTSLPDFEQLTPRETVTVETVHLPSLVRKEHFGLVFTGYLNVPTTGIYTVAVASDDDAVLFLAGEKVAGTGRIALKAGAHPLRLAYLQGLGSKVVEMMYEGPGIPAQAVPAEAFRHE
jgi:hypothetical protein